MRLTTVLRTSTLSYVYDYGDYWDHRITIEKTHATDPRSARQTTNPIENLNGLLADCTPNVKRWRDGQMVLRWVASA